MTCVLDVFGEIEAISSRLHRRFEADSIAEHCRDKCCAEQKLCKMKRGTKEWKGTVFGEKIRACVRNGCVALLTEKYETWNMVDGES